MSTASDRDAMEAAAEAIRKHYGDESAACGHVEAYHLRNALSESAYVDYYIQREKVRGYSDAANWAQDVHERDERQRRGE